MKKRRKNMLVTKVRKVIDNVKIRLYIYLDIMLACSYLKWRRRR